VRDGEEHKLEICRRGRVIPRAAWSEMPSHLSETRANHR